MRGLGYVEGKNVAYDIRYADGRTERLPSLFAELIERKVDILVTGSVPAVLAAKRATSKLPIVFAGVLDATAQGIVTNLARPGGNITGSTYGTGEAAIAAKWMDLLKEAAPRLSHVAVLFNSSDPQSPQQLRSIDDAARRLKVKIDRFDARDDATLDHALASIGTSGAQGLIVANAPLLGARRFKIVRFAADKGLPAMYFFHLFPDAGGLMSYGGSIEETYRKAAVYVDKILQGARPGDLPIDQPTRFELVINAKTAKALGLTLPAPLLLRADRVIQSP
jgi:putative ABC transport system substrate-binding protein